MKVQELQQGGFSNFIDADFSNSKNVRASFKSMLVDELKSEETFADSWQATFKKYFGQSSQSYYHVMNAAEISQEGLDTQ